MTLADDNLYVGTSAAEILHLVAIPAEHGDESSQPAFILASRLQPSGHDNEKDALGRRGVQQILVLPGPGKACVLCNGTASFYSLPELSPAFPNREPADVQWIGGLDENVERAEAQAPVLMIANSKRIMLVSVGEKLKSGGKNIEYPGCLRSCRRGTIACVADGKSYALLEVEHQQKIPLFPISTTSAEEEAPPPPPPKRGTQSPEKHMPSSGHGRSTSLGNLINTVTDRSRSPSHRLEQDDGLRAPASGSLAPRLPSRQRSSTESLPSQAKEASASKPAGANLRPHIVTPLPAEFMLTTGTSESDPGVGMFVNLDGDLVPRGTIEFASYPDSVLVGSLKAETVSSASSDGADKVILALCRTKNATGKAVTLEVQALPDTSPDIKSMTCRLDVAYGEVETEHSGLHAAIDDQEYNFVGVAELLRAVPLQTNKHGSLSLHQISEDDPRTSSAVEQLEQESALFESNVAGSTIKVDPQQVAKRLQEEQAFVRQFGKSRSRHMVWSGIMLWHLHANPLVLRLESRMVLASGADPKLRLKPAEFLTLFSEVRDRDPTNEVDFLSLSYIKQKISLMLFLHLLTLIGSDAELAEHQSAIESTLHGSGLDPRIVLLLIPPLAAEMSQSTQGIWLNQGIVDAANGFKSPIREFADAPIEFWLMLRHYLTQWQDKRGYGSITDEKYVFDSVDAGLLHVLLYLDQALPQGSSVQASVRSKLNNVVDYWKGDFERAILLLESYQRLYVLSRLYQSRKQARHVLGTWRRIIEGDHDIEYERDSPDLELRIKIYLSGRKDMSLAREYGLWLAKRNPALGVQVFADDSGKVKFDPQEVTQLLKEHAPGAVQQYLEYLVFNKNLDQYADDLIGYYLDSVLSVLESSEDARILLAQTYSTYRALSSPKPTYLNFIIENAPDQQWWQSRLRLLQLLGSGGYSTSATANKELTYSIPMVLERLAPFSSFLVSESIILDARQGRHKEALKLLTHGLGDYDTAVRYCYFGGPSTGSTGTIDADALPSRELQQDLFVYLFREFLVIEDMEDRLERTSQLLGKFATWFDPLQILTEIPDDWNVSILSDFLLRSFRAATSKRNEAIIIKALSAAQNLQMQADFVEACEKIGATIEGEHFDDAENGPGPAEITVS